MRVLVVVFIILLAGCAAPVQEVPSPEALRAYTWSVTYHGPTDVELTHSGPHLIRDGSGSLMEVSKLEAQGGTTYLDAHQQVVRFQSCDTGCSLAFWETVLPMFAFYPYNATTMEMTGSQNAIIEGPVTVTWDGPLASRLTTPNGTWVRGEVALGEPIGQIGTLSARDEVDHQGPFFPGDDTPLFGTPHSLAMAHALLVEAHPEAATLCWNQVGATVLETRTVPTAMGPPDRQTLHVWLDPVGHGNGWEVLMHVHPVLGESHEIRSRDSMADDGECAEHDMRGHFKDAHARAQRAAQSDIRGLVFWAGALIRWDTGEFSQTILEDLGQDRLALLAGDEEFVAQWDSLPP